MHKPLAMISLCACVLLLGACDKTPTVSATPMVNKPGQTESGAPAGPVVSLPVPSAESVVPPASATNVDPEPGRSNDTLTDAQEASAMPLPGQNNDHSAPLDPAERARTP